VVVVVVVLVVVDDGAWLPLGACQMVCVAVAPDEWSTICGCDR
jgi:hypothetical protein